MGRLTLFCTHPGAGHEPILASLSRHRNVECLRSGNRYTHPDQVLEVLSRSHKRADARALWVDVILHNDELAWRDVGKWCPLIFFAREPGGSIPSMSGMTESAARDYYRYRLRGMCEYARRVPSSLCLTWGPDVAEKISRFLDLRPPLPEIAGPPVVGGDPDCEQTYGEFVTRFVAGRRG